MRAIGKNLAGSGPSLLVLACTGALAGMLSDGWRSDTLAWTSRVTNSREFCYSPDRTAQLGEIAAPGWAEGSAVSIRLLAALKGSVIPAPSQQDSLAAAEGGDIVPCRSVSDPYPILHSIAVDPQNDLVVMSDSNRGTLLFYPRKEGNTGKQMTEPRWRVSGPATGMMFIAGVTIDPSRREVYTVDNDIGDRMLVFHYGAEGNVKPQRVLFVPHGAWGVSLNPRRDEVAISVEHLNDLLVYRREASEAEAPLRVISGTDTGLADPHGVFYDSIHDEIVVANHGNWSPTTSTSNPGMGGRFFPPSIRTFPGLATGNVAASRVISGSRTELNWPMGISVDTVHNEIAVANFGNNAILIFHRTDQGDVVPVRILHGNLTGIAGPMGVAVDVRDDELWVSNSDDHSALVFARTAEGNVSPKRVIRNAPPGTPVVGFGNPGALAYDSKRDELLVPN